VTAKTLAYATSARVVGVNTLQTIAYQARDYLLTTSQHGCDHGILLPRRICAAINSQRGQVFSARFPFSCDWLENQAAVETIDRDAWADRLEADDLATGPALTRLQSKLLDGKFPFQLAPMNVWYPSAQTVGRIGFRQFCRYGADDMWKLQPLYMRPSYADQPQRD
jgi:tRNA A37 threonylcarbamoyladenosine modification protein TsaB